jgi:hypothetical protein
MPNVRGQSGGMPQHVGETGPSNAIQTTHMQLTNGIERNNLTAYQFQVTGGANATAKSKSLAGYQADLVAQVNQVPNHGPPNQGV